MKNFSVSKRAVLASVVMILMIFGVVGAVATNTPQPLPTPTNLELDTDRASTTLTARWDAVDGAAFYRVRWRARGAAFASDNLLDVSASEVALNVADQGLWVIRVEACRADGCGRGATATARVIINISGRPAVRFWYDHQTEKMHLDWDALPGRYVVKYRFTESPLWQTSVPLERNGYEISFDQLDALPGNGKLVIRVFFNCNANGGQCALLGRVPDNTLESTDDEAPVVLHNPLVPASATGGATGAAGSNNASEYEIDPITGQMRTDLTVTTEIIDGMPARCVSRPAENAWERAMFGPIARSCIQSVTDQIYQLDPEAVFPDGARCGTRLANNDAERRIYGNEVTVCNAVTPSEIDQENGDGTGNSVSGQSHTLRHRADRYIHISGWPDRIARPGGNIDSCRRDSYTNYSYYSGTSHLTGNGYFPTSITVDWCYRWRHRIEEFQTIRATAWQPRASFFQNGIRLQFPWKFCGWASGFSPTNPYEFVWQYGRPPTDMWYGSAVIAQYGPHPPDRGLMRALPECTHTLFRGGAGIIVDWENQDGKLTFSYRGQSY